MLRLRFFVTSLVFLLFFMPSAWATNPDDCRVKVFDPDPMTLRFELEKAGLDVLGTNRAEGFVEIIASPSALDRLVEQGFRTEIIESYANRKTRSVPSEYNDYGEMVALLNATATAYPDLAKLIDVGSFYDVGMTYENRNILAMKISDNVTVDEDEPNILLTLNIHAREVTTLEYGLWTIEKLTTQYLFNSDIKKWVDNNQIYIICCLNPDGKQYCHDVDEWWRKNRMPYFGDHGVDLNRNYDFNWDGPAGGSTDPGYITYRGPSANSEQETKCVVAMSEERRFVKYMDFHSYGQELLYTYYYSSNMPSIIENYMEDNAEAISDAFNYNGWYRKPSAQGEAYQWQLCDISTFAFLVETGTSFIPSFSTAVSEWNDHIWPGIQYFFDHEIPLRGHVTSAVTGAPIEADISIQGINYTQGEQRKTYPKFGSFSYFLPAGTYNVTFTAAGYSPVTKTVQIEAGKSTLLEIQMGTGPFLTVNGIAEQDGVLDLDFDWTDGPGQIYFNGISLSKDTGFTFKNGVHVPVDWDILYGLTLGNIPDWFGYLDGSGHADAILPIPREPAVLGLHLYMAYFTMDATTILPLAASTAVNIFICP